MTKSKLNLKKLKKYHYDMIYDLAYDSNQFEKSNIKNINLNEGYYGSHTNKYKVYKHKLNSSL